MTSIQPEEFPFPDPPAGAAACFSHLALLVETDGRPAALNMAIDEALLRRAAAPLLRVYRWERPAVSFGYFGNIEEVERAWPGRDIVRRWTGGGTVPHGSDFTYTLVVPAGHAVAALAPAESYRAIHQAVAMTLQRAGYGPQLAAVAAPKTSDACFENAVRDDVIVGARKIAGSAQRRTREGLLHQGSIQLDGVGAEFAERLAGVLSRQVSGGELDGAVLAAAERLSRERYATEAWLRRR